MDLLVFVTRILLVLSGSCTGFWVGEGVRPGVFYCRYRRATGKANYVLGNMYKGRDRATRTVSLLLFMIENVSIITSALHGTSSPISRRIGVFIASTLFYAVAGTGFSSRDVLGQISEKLTLHGKLVRRTGRGGIFLPRMSRLA